jgi:hypothetical protein
MVEWEAGEVEGLLVVTSVVLIDGWLYVQRRGCSSKSRAAFVMRALWAIRFISSIRCLRSSPSHGG